MEIAFSLVVKDCTAMSAFLKRLYIQEAHKPECQLKKEDVEIPSTAISKTSYTPVFSFCFSNGKLHCTVVDSFKSYSKDFKILKQRQNKIHDFSYKKECPVCPLTMHRYFRLAQDLRIKKSQIFKRSLLQ